MSEFVVRNGLIVSGSTYLEAISQSNEAYILSYDSVTNEVAYMPTSSVVVTVPGSDTQIIYNNGGVFGASSNLVFSGSRVGIGVTNPGHRLEVRSGTSNSFFTSFTPSAGSGFINIYQDSNNHPSIYGGNASGTSTIVLNTSGVSYLTGGNFIIGGTADNGATLQVVGNISGSSNLSINGNIGIGTVSPAAKLQIAGGNLDGASLTDLGISSGLTTGRLGTFDASSLASISTRGDASSVELAAGSSANYYTGISATANNATLLTGTLRFFTSGSERMRITSAGNVGIGTTAPVGILHLYKAAAATRLAIDGDAGQNRLISYRTGALQRFGLYVNNTAESGGNAGSNFAIRAYSDAGTLLSTPFFINRATGNVGIGTTNPQAKLDVSGSIALGGTTGRIYYPRRIVLNSAGDFAINNNADSENLLYVDTTKVWVSGSLGVGTSSPAAKLDVAYSTNPTTATPHIILTTGGTSKQAAITAESFNVGGLVFSTGDGTLVDRMTILRTNGNVGIGLTNPSHKLTVLGAVSASSFTGSFSGTASNAISASFAATASSADAFYVRGNVGIGTSSPSYKLDVNGTGRFVGNSGAPALQITDGGSTFSVLGISGSQAGDVNWLLMSGYPSAGNFTIRQSDTVNALVIQKTTGAATFSAGVTATSFTGSFSGSASAPGSTTQVVFNNGGVLAANSGLVYSGSNVGVNLTAPTQKLSIRGNQVFTNQSVDGVTNALIAEISSQARGYSNQGANMASVQFRTNPSTWYTGEIAFLTNETDGTDPNVAATERMRITNTGNVGIGTTSPGSKLTVIGDIATSTRVASDTINGYTGGSTPLTIQTGGSQNIIFGTNNTERMRITSAGNVGIGTSSPSARLSLGAASQGQRITWEDYSNIFSEYSSGDLWLSSNFYGVSGSSGYKTSITATYGAAGISVSGTGGGLNGVLKFFADDAASKTAGDAFTPTERMRITGGGNVGIGTNSPTHKLSVLGAVSASSFTGSFSGTATNAISASFAATASSADGFFVRGNVGIGTTAPSVPLEISYATGNALKIATNDATTNNNAGIVIENVASSTSTTRRSVFIMDPTSGTGTGGDYFYITAYGNGLTSLTNAKPDGILVFGTADTERMRITSAGVVGIGTTNPLGLFEVKGDGVSYFTRGTKSLLLNPNVVGQDTNALIDTSTGMALAFATAGTERMRILTGGNVGIGTTNPLYKLHVSGGNSYMDGNLTVTGAITAQELYVEYISSSIIYSTGSNKFGDATSDTHQFTGSVNISGSVNLAAGTVIYGDTTNPSLTLDQTTGTYLKYSTTSELALQGSAAFLKANDVVQLRTGTTNHVHVSSSGYVGIGTTSPAYKLDVAGEGKVTGKFRVGGAVMLAEPGTGVLLFGSEGGSQTAIYSAGSEVIRINTAGSVGIGTTNPAQKLSVVGSGNTYLQVNNGSNNVYFGKISGAGTIQSDDDITFRPASSELMRLTSANVGIGTASPAQKLQVSGSIALNTSTDGTSRYYTYPDVNHSWYYDSDIVGSSADVITYYENFLLRHQDTTNVFVVNGSGNVGIGTASPGGQLSIFDTNNSKAYQMSFGYETTETFRLGNNNATGKFTFTQLNNSNGFRFTSVAPNSTGIIFDINTSQFAVNGDTGNVGIGTSSPNARLEVSASSGTGLALLSYGNIRTGGIGSSGGEFIASGKFGNSNVMRMYHDDSNGYIQVDNVVYAGHLILQPTSNVGIGTTNPTLAKLQVQGNVTATSFTGSFSGSASAPGSTTQVVFNNGGVLGADSGLVYSGSNVGIGTTSPVNRIQANYSPVAVSSLTATAGTAATNWNRNAGVLISGASISNAIAIGVSGTANDRKAWIQSGHPDSAADSLGIISLNPLGGNVGIGTSAPTHKLEVAGGIASTFGSTNGYVALQAGGATVQGYIEWFKPTPTRVAYMGYNDGVSANNLGLTLENSANFVINGGNVGIGTTSPVSPLQVNGTAQFGDVASMTFSGASVNIRTTATGSIALTHTAVRTYTLGVDSSGTFNIRDYSAPADRLSITSGGNVGIGTTSPARKLHIEDTTGNPQLVIGDGASVYSSFQSANSLYINAGQGGGGSDTIFRRGTGLTESMRITSTGNVGIGTTNPNSGSLQIFTAASTNQLVLNGGSSYPNVYAGNFLGSLYLSTNYYYSGGHVSDNASLRSMEISMTTDEILFATMPAGSPGTRTRLMTISGSQGFIGIGTTSPGAKLHIYGSGQTELRIGSSTGNTDSILSFYEVGLASWGIQAGQANGSFSIKDLYNSATRLTISNGGNVGIGTTNPAYTLDVSGSGRFNGTGTNGYVYISGNAGGGGSTNPDHRQGMNFSWNKSNGGGESLITYADAGGGANIRFGVGYWNNTTYSEQFSIISSGNVGIGITSPTRSLTVKSSNIGIRMDNSSNSNAGLEYYVSTGTFYNWLLGAQYNVANTFEITPSTTIGGTTYSTPAFVVNANGNVGIGTTSPGIGDGTYVAPLTINSTSNLGTFLAIKNTSAQYGMGGVWMQANTGSAGWLFGTENDGKAVLHYGSGVSETAALTDAKDGTKGITIDTAGNVGIGTTSPYAPLNVKVTGLPPTSGQQGYFGNVVLQGDSGYYNRLRFDTNGTGSWGVAVNPDRKFVISRLDSSFVGTPDDSNFVIDTSGSVGIGTTNPSQKLSVVGDFAIANTNSIQESRIGKYQSGSLGSGTHTIASISVTNVDAVFFDYVIKNSTTDLRAGTVMAVTNGSTVEYTDISTADIGDTSRITMISDVSGGNIRLRASIDTGSGSWTVRTLLRTI